MKLFFCVLGMAALPATIANSQMKYNLYSDENCGKYIESWSIDANPFHSQSRDFNGHAKSYLLANDSNGKGHDSVKANGRESCSSSPCGTSAPRRCIIGECITVREGIKNLDSYTEFCDISNPGRKH